MTYQLGEINGQSFKPTKASPWEDRVVETITDVAKYPILAIEDRKITKKTAEHFGVRTAMGDDGTTPVAIYFPYTEKGEVIGYKKRDLTKHKKDKGYFTAVGTVKVDVCELFGAECGNSTGGKKVWITEGEFDAMTCYQVLKDQYPQGNPTVMSIGFGTANAVQHIGQKHNMRHLNKFVEKILAFDNDKATPAEREKKIKKGAEATADVYGLIPDIYVAPLPEDKDPCDVFADSAPSILYWMLMKPARFTPEGFITYSEVREKCIELPTLGKSWPWESVTRKTLGRRHGEGIYFGAGVKMGKSELANKLIEHIVTTETNRNGDSQKAAVFKFEESPDETIKKVAGKFYRKDYVNPEKIIFIDTDGTEIDVWGEKIHNNENYFTPEDLQNAVDDIGPRLVTYNNYGRCNWDELKGAIRHAVLVEHIEDIFIDPITRLTAGMTPSEANTELERFADEISKMSQDLGFTYYCFCHLKAPAPPAKPHENGGRIYSSQFRGSRAMMQACHYMMGLEGNKDPDLPDKEKNTRYLTCLDDRKYGRTFKIPLFYDVDTGDFAEPPEGFLDDEECQTLTEWNIKYPNGMTPTDF